MPVKLGGLNVARIMRTVSHRTGQGRKVTYYRKPIYAEDNYGVSTSTVAVQELLIPDLQVYIHPLASEDYQLSKGGHNIVGTALIYTPNITTIKSFSNFSQDNNVYFNDVEGWDQLIDVDRHIYNMPTNSTSSWSVSGMTATLSTDDESLYATMGATGSGSLVLTVDKNVLEADRIQFFIKSTGTANLDGMKSYNGGVTDAYALSYTASSSAVLGSDWLVVDAPFITNTSATSIYQDGTRIPVTVSASSSHNYESNLKKFIFQIGGNSGSVIRIKLASFYKSTEWSIHELTDYTTDYIKLVCYKTRGRRDSVRRAR